MSTVAPEAAVEIKIDPPKLDKRIRLEFLDGMRGMSALWVVFSHIIGNVIQPGDPRYLSHGLHRFATAFSKSGHYAVDTFIVLSGFCLMLPVARRADGQLQGGMGEFIKRRARRILPPYYVAFVFALIVCWLFTWAPIYVHPQTFLLSHYRPSFSARDAVPAILSHIFMVFNLNPDWIERYNGVFWSVATEWQIYFVFPLLLLPIWRRYGVAPTVLVGTLVGLIGVLPPVTRACFWFIGLFAMGMTAAVFVFPSDEVKERPRQTAIYLAIAIAILCLVAKKCERPDANPIHDIVFGAIVMCQLIWCARSCVTGPRPNAVVRFFDWAPITALGAFSYSLYLTHIQIIQLSAPLLMPHEMSRTKELLTMTFIGLPLCLLFAYGFYLLIERPFMNRRPKTEKILP